MSSPSKPPFWEQARGGGPITDRINSRRQNAKTPTGKLRADAPLVRLGGANTDGCRRIVPAMPRRQVGE